MYTAVLANTLQAFLNKRSEQFEVYGKMKTPVHTISVRELVLATVIKYTFVNNMSFICLSLRIESWCSLPASSRP